MAQPHYSGAYGASPHCQACHATAPNNQFGPWHSSHHARAYENLPTSAKSNPVCLPCHTTGWDISQHNGGFDDYFYAGDSSGMAQMRSVQCESCHGPTSQIPHPATTMVDLQSEVCGDCHTGMGKPTYPEWSSCGHRQTAPASAQNLACAKCHEAGSAAAYLRTGLEPVALPANPVWQVTCASCHATHSTPVYESQLYLPSDSTCRACHTIDRAVVGETFYASQKEMLLGPGSGAYEWPGYTYNNSCHQSFVPDPCVLCHQWTNAQGNPDTTTTGHALTPNIQMCVVCHSGQIPPDSSFNINGCQTMIDSLLNALGAMLAQADTTTIEYRRAKFDYDFVNKDKSHGVHNFMYAEDLLMSSMANLPMPAMVDIDLMPMMMMVRIPSGGGSFDYDAMLMNMGTTSSNCDVWIKIKMPNGTWTTPVVGPINLTLPGGASITRSRSQNIPGSWPNGSYTYRGYVGDYPGTRWDSSGFNFTKGMCADGEPGDLFLNETNVTQQPTAFGLIGATPNPFNPTTAISYRLATSRQVSLKVYDASGREVISLVDGWQEAGTHEAIFDGLHLAAGMYLARLTAGDYTAVQKLVLVK
jgi:predicted CXXCH cytochrome family protein